MGNELCVFIIKYIDDINHLNCLFPSLQSIILLSQNDRKESQTKQIFFRCTKKLLWRTQKRHAKKQQKEKLIKTNFLSPVRVHMSNVMSFCTKKNPIKIKLDVNERWRKGIHISWSRYIFVWKSNNAWQLLISSDKKCLKMSFCRGLAIKGSWFNVYFHKWS